MCRTASWHGHRHGFDYSLQFSFQFIFCSNTWWILLREKHLWRRIRPVNRLGKAGFRELNPCKMFINPTPIRTILLQETARHGRASEQHVKETTKPKIVLPPPRVSCSFTLYFINLGGIVFHQRSFTVVNRQKCCILSFLYASNKDVTAPLIIEVCFILTVNMFNSRPFARNFFEQF